MNKGDSISGGLSSTLDASRWIAAAMVVLAHVHRLVMVNFPLVEQPTSVIKSLYFFGSYGSEAVIIFFVISGYLVGGTTAKRWQDGQRYLWSYVAQRVARIYTVLIPALILGCGLDALGAALYGSRSLYGSESVINQMAPIDISPITFIGNFLMLEGTWVPVLGTNGPLWSLAYEWWYYCIFAAALAFWFHSGWKAWLSGLVIIVAIALLPLKIWLWMSIWGAGVAAFYLDRSTLRKPPAWVGTVVILAALVVCRFNHNHERSVEESIAHQLLRDGFLGLAFAFSIVCWSTMTRPIRGAGTHKFLAGFSYSLYLVHFPVLVIATTVLKWTWGVEYARQPSPQAYAVVALLLIGLFTFAWAFSRLTERYTGQVFRYLYRLGSGDTGRRQIPEER